MFLSSGLCTVSSYVEIQDAARETGRFTKRAPVRLCTWSIFLSKTQKLGRSTQSPKRRAKVGINMPTIPKAVGLGFAKSCRKKPESFCQKALCDENLVTDVIHGYIPTR